MDWEQATTQSTITGNGKSAGWILDASEVRDRYTDPTLMATRVWGGIRQQAAVAAHAFAGVGLIAWDDPDNLAPNLAADIPGVFSNGDLDWIARWVTPLFETTGGTFQTFVSPIIFDLAHSVKSKRRLGQNRGLLVCHENTGSSQVTFMFDWRMLIKA